MPGPNGEECQTCYYFEALPGGEYGLCRHDHADAWISRPGGPATGNWPRVRRLDWSGDWRELTTPSATAGLITPTGATFTPSSETVWQHFVPSLTMVPSTVVVNCTTTSNSIVHNIPTPPPGVTWSANFNMFGSVTHPSANTFSEWTLGDETNTPFSADIFQRVDINGPNDDRSAPLGFSGGPSLAGPSGTTRILVRGSTQAIAISSMFFQITVEQFAT